MTKILAGAGALGLTLLVLVPVAKGHDWRDGDARPRHGVPQHSRFEGHWSGGRDTDRRHHVGAENQFRRPGFDGKPWPGHRKPKPWHFNRIATLPNYLNNADAGRQTVSEIVAATRDGKTLVYTDSPGEQIGFVDITRPTLPISAGTLGMDGEPTSVAVLGNDLALVAVDTSPSFTGPSGELKVVEIRRRRVVASLELGGQPDSIAISPDRRYAAIAIENERDQDVSGPDGVEGGLPQAPAGFLAVIELAGSPDTWSVARVDMTGLGAAGAYAAGDPEPEFVDINADNEAVVTLQENNVVCRV